jgi:hypothetical protein
VVGANPKPTTCTPSTNIFSNKSGVVSRSVSDASISDGRDGVNGIEARLQ